MNNDANQNQEISIKAMGDRTLNNIIRAALRAYPDNDLLPVDAENIEADEAVQLARTNQFGDGLLSFALTEIEEGVAQDGRDGALRLIERAIKDLEAVRDGINDLG